MLYINTIILPGPVLCYIGYTNQYNALQCGPNCDLQIFNVNTIILILIQYQYNALQCGPNCDLQIFNVNTIILILIQYQYNAIQCGPNCDLQILNINTKLS